MNSQKLQEMQNHELRVFPPVFQKQTIKAFSTEMTKHKQFVLLSQMEIWRLVYFPDGVRDKHSLKCCKLGKLYYIS